MKLKSEVESQYGGRLFFFFFQNGSSNILVMNSCTTSYFDIGKSDMDEDWQLYAEDHAGYGDVVKDFALLPFNPATPLPQEGEQET